MNNVESTNQPRKHLDVVAVVVLAAEHRSLALVNAESSPGEVLEGGGGGGGAGGIPNATLTVTRTFSFVQVGGNARRCFGISLIVRDKDTSRCPQKLF